LLCEDLEQERLFRPILEELGPVRVVRGKTTGGFTFVFKSALKEEATYVRQRPKEAVGLLVVVDGDQVGSKGRLDQIQEVLRLVGFETKDKMPDRIAACIPSRNVETWLLWLGGRRELDEHTDYKTKLQIELKNIRWSQLLEAWFLPSEEQLRAEKATLPALASGRAEIDRLKKLAKG